MNALERGLIVAASMGGMMLLGHTAADAATQSSPSPAAAVQVAAGATGSAGSVVGQAAVSGGQRGSTAPWSGGIRATAKARQDAPTAARRGTAATVTACVLANCGPGKNPAAPSAGRSSGISVSPGRAASGGIRATATARQDAPTAARRGTAATVTACVLADCGAGQRPVPSGTAPASQGRTGPTGASLTASAVASPASAPHTASATACVLAGCGTRVSPSVTGNGSLSAGPGGSRTTANACVLASCGNGGNRPGLAGSGNIASVSGAAAGGQPGTGHGPSASARACVLARCGDTNRGGGASAGAGVTAGASPSARISADAGTAAGPGGSAVGGLALGGHPAGSAVAGLGTGGLGRGGLGRDTAATGQLTLGGASPGTATAGLGSFARGLAGTLGAAGTPAGAGVPAGDGTMAGARTMAGAGSGSGSGNGSRFGSHHPARRPHRHRTAPKPHGHHRPGTAPHRYRQRAPRGNGYRELAYAPPPGAASAYAAQAPAPGGTGNWLITRADAHLLYRLDPGVTRHFFDTASSFESGPNNGAVPVADGLAATGVLVYTSFARFAADAASHAIPAYYRWVLYDPEMWSQTPVSEQRNPALYLRLFGQLAHAYGLNVIEAPGLDLGLVSGSACPRNSGESVNHWYLRCNIAGAAAAYSDILVVQDAENTASVSEFDSLYNAAHWQARTANPHAGVYAEVSTEYATPGQMAAAAQSVTADGYYLSVPSASGAGSADRFLRDMEAAGC